MTARPKVCAIVQARMGSQRLPGKVLAAIDRAPMLAHVVERAAACAAVDQVVIATGDGADDDPIAVVARSLGVSCWRGSRHDVLARYRGAADASGADVVVRLTADCPLLDPAVIGDVVAALVDGPDPCDYASNTFVRTFPRGLDAEACWIDTLHRLDRLARAPHHREHVTALVHDRPDWFVTASVEGPVDASDLRLTVDTEADLELVRLIHARLAPSPTTPHAAIVALLRREPALVAINAAVEQRSWHHAERAAERAAERGVEVGHA
ncbi:MAG TPA: glycosyltransferase family protein [Kofleriaceae bacterium]|nr:glycosyltransferase family protein [Kofleriaceae bacterium]